MATSNTKSISQVFVETRNKPTTSVAFRYSDGTKWHDISWPEYYRMSERLAAGLASIGVKRGDRVAIMSNTRYQWAAADMAILGMGCVTVPIYQNSTLEDVGFIINNSNAVAAIAEDDGQVQKLRRLGSQIPSLKHIVAITPVTDSDTHQWESFLKKGETYLKTNPNYFIDECRKAAMSDMATIVYTSGTTGQPKGVVLLHSCIASECSDLETLLDLGEKDSTLTFLPFAHIFGRVELWANIYIGWKIGFAESIDRIAANLVEIKPTFMMAVPRIFEKIYAKILGQVDEGSPAKKQIFKWAIKVGSEVSKCKCEKKPIPLALLIQYKVAYKLVFSKINAKLGGNIRFLVSGGAPLSKQIAEFFHAAGILVCEGYGLTETTAAVTINTPYKYRFGTVGPTLGDSQIKIASDGEILIKSKKVFREYFLNPEATKEVLTQDGWFHSGDIGEIDGDGFIRITDRKKDLIITAAGKNIAPQKIEGVLKTNKFISQVVIFGDKMKYLVALVTLNPDELKKFAVTHSLEHHNPQDLVKHSKVQDAVREIIREKNGILASYETIKNFTILPIDFSIENGELTPSMKVKRKHLSQKYESIIRDLYVGH
ncbi:MAG: long-chain fatty acid--CoA ligase [Oligoflexia bacterium]|nr:long-chain fatty acid--CoA ligase [Oligoflexia bacterium]